MGAKVLLVDDEKDFVEGTSRTFAKQGIRRSASVQWGRRDRSAESAGG